MKFLSPILVFSLVISLCTPFSLASDLYSLSPDTVPVDGEGEEVGSASILSTSLADMAGLYSSSSPNYWTANEINQLITNVVDIRNGLTTVTNGTVRYLLNNMNNNSNSLLKLFGFPAGKTLWAALAAIDGDINSIAVNGVKADVDFTPLVKQMGFPDNFSFYQGGKGRTAPAWYASDGYVVGNEQVDGRWDYGNWYRWCNALLRNLQHSGYNAWSALGADGRLISVGGNQYLHVTLENGFMGLASIMRGQSGAAVTGQLLNSSGLSGADFSANNLLSALGVIVPIQNDIAKLRYVLANDDDIEIRDSQKENMDAIKDGFTGGGAGALKPDNVGGMADLSGSLSGVLETEVGVGDLFGQLGSGGEGWGFFSEAVANDLNTVPASYALEDDDFVSFFDAEHREFYRLIGGEGK